MLQIAQRARNEEQLRFNALVKERQAQRRALEEAEDQRLLQYAKEQERIARHGVASVPACVPVPVTVCARVGMSCCDNSYPRSPHAQGEGGRRGGCPLGEAAHSSQVAGGAVPCRGHQGLCAQPPMSSLVSIAAVAQAAEDEARAKRHVEERVLKEREEQREREDRRRRAITCDVSSVLCGLRC